MLTKTHVNREWREREVSKESTGVDGTGEKKQTELAVHFSVANGNHHARLLDEQTGLGISGDVLGHPGRGVQAGPRTHSGQFLWNYKVSAGRSGVHTP